MPSSRKFQPLLLQRVDLGLQYRTFLLLALQEASGQCQLLGHAVRGQQIRVTQLVVASLEIVHLNQALGHKCS
jgi:hypothetical protein